jgi:hypothetical protein
VEQWFNISHKVRIYSTILTNEFFLGVKTNLHIVLIMDFTRPTFTIACQSNPGFFKECAVQWLEGWSERSMIKVIQFLLKIFIIFLFRFH